MSIIFVYFRLTKNCQISVSFSFSTDVDIFRISSVLVYAVHNRTDRNCRKLWGGLTFFYFLFVSVSFSWLTLFLFDSTSGQQLKSLLINQNNRMISLAKQHPCCWTRRYVFMTGRELWLIYKFEIHSRKISFDVPVSCCCNWMNSSRS